MTTKIDALRGDLAAALDAYGGFLFERWATKVRERRDEDLIRKMLADVAQIARTPKAKTILTAACRLWIAMQETK